MSEALAEALGREYEADDRREFLVPLKIAEMGDLMELLQQRLADRRLMLEEPPVCRRAAMMLVKLTVASSEAVEHGRSTLAEDCAGE